MKLSKNLWAARPQQPQALFEHEPRTVMRIYGGRVIETKTELVPVRHAWREGPCRHVVLLVSTRARVDARCPDCSPPEVLIVYGKPPRPEDQP